MKPKQKFVEKKSKDKNEEKKFKVQAHGLQISMQPC